MCKVISCASQKGGVTKTTTVLNLATALALKGKKVLAVDTDPQGSLTICAGVKNPDNLTHSTYTLMNAVLNEDKLSDPTQTSTDAVIKGFRDLYIRQRYHDPRFSEVFEAALKARIDGIYDDGFVATKEESERHVENAGHFLEMSRVISNRHKAL